MLLVILQLFGILAILTFIILSIWSFVILNRAYTQFKYSNYLMEKLQSAILALNKTIKNSSIENYVDKRKDISSLDESLKKDMLKEKSMEE